MTDLEQLRADLAVLERYQCTEVAKMRCRERIAVLEAKAADPWWEAKKDIEESRSSTFEKCQRFIAYVDHLTAEVDRLKKRVAELEAGCDVLKRQHDHVFDDRERLKKRLAELERLDPARVLATAADLGWGPTVYAEMTILRDAKPYPLKDATNAT